MINNIPKYAEDRKYIVAREVDGEFWFWGAFDDNNEAHRTAGEIDGYVFDRETL